MNDDKRHLQLRLDPETREQIESISKRFRISNSDAVRGALFFGIPVLEAFTDLSERLIDRLVAKLKRDARVNSQ